MKRGQIVAKKKPACKRVYGAVVDTEMREKWRFVKVQWIEDKNSFLPVDKKAVWIRHDEVVLVEPFSELANVQRVMTLSSALLSENYRKVLNKQYGKKKKKRK